MREFWKEIGAGEYDISAIKSADILHPALRYVHKLLASTLYARKEAGRIVQDELHFLIFGISSVTKEYRQGRYEHQPGTVGIFIERLIYYKKWACTNHDKKPKLFILRFITPLLETMNIPLVGDGIEFAVMDEVHLYRTGFLDGILDGKYIYRYKKGSRKEYCSVLLPCLPSTSLRYRENLTFNPPSSALLHPATQDMPLKISRKKKQPGDSSSQSEDVEQPLPSTVYWSTRYYFEPRTASLPEGPLRDAHNQIRALQRGQKYQDRTISKLVKSINYLAGKLKKLTMRTRRSHASTTEASEEEIRDDMQTEATEPVQDHQHSYHGDATATQSYYEAPRSSVREPRERRNRRQRHPVPSLPSPDTDNESPFVPTSDTDEQLGHTEP